MGLKGKRKKGKRKRRKDRFLFQRSHKNLSFLLFLPGGGAKTRGAGKEVPLHLFSSLFGGPEYSGEQKKEVFQ